MTDISKEAVDALVPLLNYGVCQDQYDDVEIYETEQLMKKAAQSLSALRAALNEAEARETALLAANETNRETLLRIEALETELAVSNELGKAFEEDAGQQRNLADALAGPEIAALVYAATLAKEFLAVCDYQVGRDTASVLLTSALRAIGERANG